VSNNLSYADALRGRVGKPNSMILKDWRCRHCGSWDVQVTPQQRGQETSNLGEKDRGMEVGWFSRAVGSTELF